MLGQRIDKDNTLMSSIDPIPLSDRAEPGPQGERPIELKIAEAEQSGERLSLEDPQEQQDQYLDLQLEQFINSKTNTEHSQERPLSEEKVNGGKPGVRSSRRDGWVPLSSIPLQKTQTYGARANMGYEKQKTLASYRNQRVLRRRASTIKMKLGSQGTLNMALKKKGTRRFAVGAAETTSPNA